MRWSVPVPTRLPLHLPSISLISLPSCATFSSLFDSSTLNFSFSRLFELFPQLLSVELVNLAPCLLRGQKLNLAGFHWKKVRPINNYDQTKEKGEKKMGLGWLD